MRRQALDNDGVVRHLHGRFVDFVYEGFGPEADKDAHHDEGGRARCIHQGDPWKCIAGVKGMFDKWL